MMDSNFRRQWDISLIISGLDTAFYRLGFHFGLTHLVYYYKEGVDNYHHLHIKEFIDINSESCGLQNATRARF